jgi:hypothetical protein
VEPKNNQHLSLAPAQRRVGGTSAFNTTQAIFFEKDDRVSGLFGHGQLMRMIRFVFALRLPYLDISY